MPTAETIRSILCKLYKVMSLFFCSAFRVNSIAYFLKPISLASAWGRCCDIWGCSRAGLHTAKLECAWRSPLQRRRKGKKRLLSSSCERGRKGSYTLQSTCLLDPPGSDEA